LIELVYFGFIFLKIQQHACFVLEIDGLFPVVLLVGYVVFVFHIICTTDGIGPFNVETYLPRRVFVTVTVLRIVVLPLVLSVTFLRVVFAIVLFV